MAINRNIFFVAEFMQSNTEQEKKTFFFSCKARYVMAVFLQACIDYKLFLVHTATASLFFSLFFTRKVLKKSRELHKHDLSSKR